MKPIVGIGIACLDHLIVVPDLARRGGQVEDFLVEGGGVIATALVAASRLGAPTKIWTRLGDDEIGRAIAEGLEREGVDTRAIEFVRASRSPVSVVHVDSKAGERVIFHFRGDAFASAGDLPDLGEIGRAGVLLVDSTWQSAAVAGARLARESGVPVVGDFDPRQAPDLAALVDHLIVNEQTAREIAGGDDPETAVGVLRRKYPAGVVAVTMGARGCWYSTGGAIRHQGAFRVKVRDTTGAGDAFHGGYAFAIARGWQVEKAVQLASAVGALCCTGLGGRSRLPDLQTALSLAETGVA